jgi:hypothetical protein
MDQLVTTTDRLKKEPELAHATAVAALDDFSESVGQLMAKNPVDISHGLGPEVPIPRTFDLDDSQFLKAAGDAEQDPNRAFRFVEQATLEFLPILARGFPAARVRLARLRHVAATSVDASVRGGLLQRLDWMEAMGLFYGVVKSDGPAAALEDLMRGDPEDSLLDQLPCTSFPRTALAFLATYGPWDKRGPLPPGFPPPADPVPESVNDWWDPRFLASVCYRVSALTALLEARPAGQHVVLEDLSAVGRPPAELISDRRGRRFMPWTLLLARLQEDSKTYDYEELRDELEQQLGLRYSEVIGEPPGAH